MQIQKTAIIPNRAFDHHSNQREEELFFQHTACPIKGTDVSQAIINQTAIAVSDGSVKDEIGSASWILTGDNEKLACRGNHGVLPSNATMTSHRAEL